MNAKQDPHRQTEDASGALSGELERLCADAGRPAAGARCRALADLVAGLGMEPEIVEAAAVYPALRAGVLDLDAVTRRYPGPSAALCAELAQLTEMSPELDDPETRGFAPDQAEGLRRMLLAVVRDVRVVLVRLADVLLSLREARDAPAETQRLIAVQCRDIYAPLANRLGIWQLKWELEDLSFRFLEPESYRRIAGQLNQRRGDREAIIHEVRERLSAELDGAGIEADISGRPKHIYSIWRKMQRKDTELDKIFDVLAMRIFVNDVRDCYAALGIVHNLWSYLPQEFDDYIANPKANLYQSLHTAVMGPQGQPLEVQIRTHDMHRHAELGVAAHWRYKEGGSAPGAFEQKVRWLRQLLEPGEAEGGEDFVERVREEIMEDRVYAFSPKGDVVDLPAGATPLDFAYSVHTQVGHRCRGARVNGRIVPLGYRIRNGDQVEIITASRPSPSRDWLVPRLGFLASARNRAKVRAWFRRQDREQNRKQGREILERELSRFNLKSLPVADIAAQLKQDSADALYVALGSGDLTAAAVANAAHQLTAQEPEPLPVRRRRRRTAAPGGDIRVRGVGDLMSNLARCCGPVPPEPIVGYITVGRGVSIHRRDCRNVLRLMEQQASRIIEVEWGEDEEARYPVELRIEAWNRDGLLRDISSVLSDEHIGIIGSRSDTDQRSRKANIELSVEVPDLETLSRTLSRIERLPNVISVRRDA
ncbi:MAG TPA: bifunctional (p)ppGpp synthetase/guanosine-3',5'-bis(diphosphate) 3'-pyrophosphohydrolase [Woeseiaceae bacterium]|nr:bifunctional (p)ppGpp synthetase/guanosine-3',5'-bis(diphosphate) 3'-pyrophosphohydrolase [Woeseiaceae bacterium]